MIPRLSQDPGATLLKTLSCSSFDRADPIWTNPKLPASRTDFYCSCSASEPLLRIQWDGRNRYEPRHLCHVAEVPDACIGYEGVAFSRDRIYSSTPESGTHESLRYLARFTGLEFDPRHDTVRIESPSDLTSELDVYYERKMPKGAIPFAGLRAHYSNGSDAPDAPLPGGIEGHISRHDKLVRLVGKRSYVYYFHLTHILPLFCLMKDALLANPNVEILTTGCHDDFFTLLGIDPRRLVKYDPRNLYHCKSAYLSTPVPFLAPPRELLQLIRPAYVGNGCNAKDRIVFIRRTLGQQTAFRNQVREILRLRSRLDFCVLENHDEILHRLRQAFPDHEVMDFDSDALSVRQQIDLFSQAKVIVGAHGSGLANMVFSAPGTHILELMPQKTVFPVFWHLAKSLDMSYRLHAVPGVSKYDNFSVPADEIVGAVRTMLKGSARS